VVVGENLKRIGSIGFKPVGKWKLVEGKLDFDLFDEPESANILYAFVVDSEVMYIGKTDRGLRSRMLNYRNAHVSQTTNTRNNEGLVKCLLQKQSVEIYGLSTDGLFQYGGFHINLAAGLEDSLIDELKPPWNVN